MFDVAVGERAISPTGHVRIMAAVQPFISGAITKMINMPAESSIEDIEEVYTRGWKSASRRLRPTAT